MENDTRPYYGGLSYRGCACAEYSQWTGLSYNTFYGIPAGRELRKTFRAIHSIAQRGKVLEDIAIFDNRYLLSIDGTGLHSSTKVKCPHCGTKNVARIVRLDGHRVANPDWRPFVVSVSKSAFRDGDVVDSSHYTPTQSTIKATFTALSSFYDFLSQES